MALASDIGRRRELGANRHDPLVVLAQEFAGMSSTQIEYGCDLALSLSIYILYIYLTMLWCERGLHKRCVKDK